MTEYWEAPRFALYPLGPMANNDQVLGESSLVELFRRHLVSPEFVGVSVIIL